ncbi:hypothetical protein [Paenibacillus senegalimassiliensis]|uniref:hypothetical protein n=1 Tax=Paenibacillus senegalimassiliensis TaxID=1737426 RepID=UPI00073F3B01|nr:hypothetical protein [Paenibacillus senegalimassiliensis]
MNSRIDVADLAASIQNNTNKLLESEVTKLIEQVALGNISDQDAIAQTAVALKTNMEVFIVSLLQNVVDELQKNSQ